MVCWNIALQCRAIRFPVQLTEGAGDTEADGFGLAFDSAAVHVDLQVEGTGGVGENEGLVDDVPQGIFLEILVERLVVDDDGTGSGVHVDASNC